MKILLLGEYSNVHATLAEGLRQLGHQVTVVSNGDNWKNYPRDIDVSRKSGKIGGLLLLIKLFLILPRLRNYDIVQLINPIFFELKAERLTWFYRYLRHHNRKMVLGAFGMDWYWVHTCTTEKPLRYSDFNIGTQLRTDASALKEQRDWIGTTKERLNQLIAEDCDAIVTGLYEYDICYKPHFPNKTQFIPYPIHLPDKYSTTQCSHSKVSIFIGISLGRSAYKGTDIMLRAAKDLHAQYSHCMKLNIAEGVPFEEYQLMMEGSDAILDQLYSYTPSMNSLLAMSKGIICIGGGEPESYDIIHENELRPIINVEPTYESIHQKLEHFILHPESISQRKKESRQYVIRHHDYLKVAHQYEAFYIKIMNT